MHEAIEQISEQYRGYQIVVVPIEDYEDLWDFEYRLRRIDGGGESRVRSQTAGGHLTPEIACVAGIEVARTEVDNLLALGSTQAQ
jgi:hypothetical protein